MSNAIDGYLARITDSALRSALTAEIDRLRKIKDFGLVFERHLPEIVRLYSHPVRRGTRVQDRAGTSPVTWVVRRVIDGQAQLVDATGNQETRPVSGLVVVGEFGEPIYPGLKGVGRVERDADKPFHTVINGENYHALVALSYLYENKVDFIYIDPPYNSGAKDWKYSNDYVDGEDAYRHSKWLSFMERRLLLSKRLLNPEHSMLVVTIDEKEVLHLGTLLEQIFPNCTVQMVTIVINPKGTARYNEFSRVEEYAFFVFIGDIRLQPSGSDMLTAREYATETAVRWRGLARTGRKGLRSNNPGSWYPIFIRESDGTIHSIGSAITTAVSDASVPTPEGTVAVWPTMKNGHQYSWSVVPETLRDIQTRGGLKTGRINIEKGQFPFYYLSSGTFDKIDKGEITVTGKGTQGELIIEFAEGAKSAMPRSVWNQTAHDAGSHGTNIVNALIPGRQFPFPKSLYAVEDTLAFFVRNNLDALVIDFFGGSGTTAHAVMRLNRQDGGTRRSIVVTNNEVSEAEARVLRAAGHLPGDPEWEALGIFEYITRPRITAAVTGVTSEGTPVVGEYRHGDEFPMSDGFDENVQFFELTYLDRNVVSQGKAFEAISPLLWMKVGATGPMIVDDIGPFAAPAGCRYAVLFDVNHWQAFVAAIGERTDVEHVFVVTDSLAQYQQIVAELPAVRTSMLYEDYLRNFEITTGEPQ